MLFKYLNRDTLIAVNVVYVCLCDEWNHVLIWVDASVTKVTTTCMLYLL
jgi:hypothetical protein